MFARLALLTILASSAIAHAQTSIPPEEVEANAAPVRPVQAPAAAESAPAAPTTATKAARAKPAEPTLEELAQRLAAAHAEAEGGASFQRLMVQAGLLAGCTAAGTAIGSVFAYNFADRAERKRQRVKISASASPLDRGAFAGLTGHF